VSDENDIIEASVEDAESGDPVGGERLAEARREMQVPVIEIAKELHLDEYKVRALERNEFEVLGAPVFAKGHLRKYAQLVNVDQADVMADYYQLNRSTGAPPVVSARLKQRKFVSPGPWLAAIVVIVIAATAYWWFTARETPVARPVTGEVAPLPQNSAPTVTEQEVVEETDEAILDELPVEPEPQPATPPVVATESADLRLSVTYLGDCWTEITDASGRRLFFDLGESGRTVNLSGEAPFNVLFGDAANVSLEVNGAAFTIPAADRRGRTARLTITGS